MVGLLLAAGACILWMLINDASEFWSSAYGGMMAIKLLVVALMLGIAAAEQVVSDPAAAEPRAQGGEPIVPLHSCRDPVRLRDFVDDSRVHHAHRTAALSSRGLLGQAPEIDVGISRNSPDAGGHIKCRTNQRGGQRRFRGTIALHLAAP